MRIIDRLIEQNARWLVVELRRAADRLELAAPGPIQYHYLQFINHEREELHMGEITLPDTSGPLTASVRFLDVHGHETPADDVPRWTSSDESVASVAASEDGLSATVTLAAPGATVIEVTSTEANTGADVVAQGTVTVQPGDAVIGDVEFEQSQPEPPAPEPGV